MPQAIIPIITTAAKVAIPAAIGLGAKTLADKVQSKTLRKNAEATASIQRINEDREDARRKVILSEDRKLAEKQLILQASRDKIETLAALNAAKAQNTTQVIQPAPQPVQRFSFIDRINAFIQGFF